MQLRSCIVTGFVPVLFAIAGCGGSDKTAAAPDVGDDELDILQTVTLPGGQTMTANQPTLTTGGTGGYGYVVNGSVTFSGPSASIGAGACIMSQVYNTYENADRSYSSDPVPCSTAADCSAYQIYTGGFAYCTAPDGVGQHYCYVRPGSQADFCVGTPATHATISVPTTLTTAWQNVDSGYTAYTADYAELRPDDWEWYNQMTWANWVTYACYGPSCSPNSISSVKNWSYGPY